MRDDSLTYYTLVRHAGIMRIMYTYLLVLLYVCGFGILRTPRRILTA